MLMATLPTHVPDAPVDVEESHPNLHEQLKKGMLPCDLRILADTRRSRTTPLCKLAGSILLL
jgi:hypothetical protein